MENQQNMIADKYYTQQDNTAITIVHDVELQPQENGLFNFQEQTNSGLQQLYHSQFRNFFYISPFKNEFKMIQRIRARGPIQQKATRFTKKLNNANKFDYRLYLRYETQWEKYSSICPLKFQKLKKFNSLQMASIGTRKISIKEMNRIFGNQSSQQTTQMSFFNSLILSSIFRDGINKIIFDKQILDNKKTYYLHVVNKYMRLQSIHLVKRLQAR